MRCAVAFVALLLASAAVTGGAVAQESPEIDGPTATTFDVRLQADGDARWVVRMSFPLDTAEERDAFRAYAAEYEAGEVSAGPSVQFFRTAAASASQVAGREMEITDVSRDFSLGTETGTLELSFRWTAFLGEDGNRYVLRDALRTPDGTWLRSLGQGQQLRIHTPPGYDIVQSIEARQQNDSLVITGPESFDADEFVVAYEPAAPRTSSDTATDTETPVPDTNWGVVATGLLGLLLAVVVLVALWRWRSSDPVLADQRADETDEPDAPLEGPAQAGEPSPAEDADANDGIDPELLSDEERVEHLLEQNGGRMRQADIVSETDWSDAKVSQLLSRMADEGSVEKLRLGRENVISLPDGDGDDA